MLEHTAALLSAICLTAYWFWVVVKLIRLARKIGKDPNAMPREAVGILLRFAWYPCVIVLLVMLWVAALAREDRLSRLLFWRLDEEGLLGQIAIIAAMLLCTFCTAATFVCWRKMGRSWRIGIDPAEKLEMVSTGPYRLVRHPIYALRMVINACVIAMVPAFWVILPAAIDMLLLQIEARREEAYMERLHGSEYARYKKSVGRFIPRAFVG